MLTREEFLKMCAAILEADDRATRSEYLTQISDHNGALDARLVLATGDADSLRERNARLLEQNTKLFLRVGNEPDAGETKESGEIELPTIESLFDEKGRLK